MKATVDDPVGELKAVRAEHLPWHGARIGFLARFLLALFKVRSVNLAELATGFGGTAQVASHYKRLQRFFRSFEIDPDSWARLRVRLVPVGDGPWRLTLDRTNWTFVPGGPQFLGAGDRLSGDRPPAVLARPGQGGQLQHRRARGLDGALPGRLWRRADRRAAGRPRIRGRDMVPVAASVTNSLPPTDQMRHPRPQPREPDPAG
ncbi:MAG: hypothetical protein V9G98_22340 [Candidatus Competibacter sp.]